MPCNVCWDCGDWLVGEDEARCGSCGRTEGEIRSDAPKKRKRTCKVTGNVTFIAA
jgi:hypothetical protein